MSIPVLLKSATNDLHQQTEMLMPSAALVDGSLSLEAYRQLISSLYQIHFKIEHFLEKAVEEHPTLAAFYENKLPWLAEDLAAMGMAAPVVSSEIPAPPTGKAALAGMMYVLEGSTLGGQVILKGLRKNGALQGLPNRYYTGYGQLTGTKWRSFMEILESVVLPEEAAPAVEGANYAFKLFMANLSEAAFT